MPEDREELLRHYRESREKLLATIEGLTDDEMSEASIDGWSVKDHLAHIALWDDMRAAEVDRISAGFESASKMTEDDDEALNETGYKVRRSMTAAQAKCTRGPTTLRLLTATELGSMEVPREQDSAPRSGWPMEVVCSKSPRLSQDQLSIAGGCIPGGS